jgi:hypothetical protein
LSILRADAFARAQEAGLFGQNGVAGDEGVDGVLDGVDLAVENLDHHPDRGLDAGLVGLMGAAAFRLTQVAQLVEPADQGGERVGLRGWRRPGRLVGDEGGETGEHSSIDRIGLRPSRAAAWAKARARLGCTRRSGRPSSAATFIRGRS